MVEPLAGDILNLVMCTLKRGDICDYPDGPRSFVSLLPRFRPTSSACLQPSYLEAHDLQMEHVVLNSLKIPRNTAPVCSTITFGGFRSRPALYELSFAFLL